MGVEVCNIAKEIERLCKERNLSYYALAKKSGMQDSSVRNMFQKGTTPTFYNLDKMCKGLGITVAQFFAQSELFENLTADQKELLDLYIRADEKEKQLILAYARGILRVSAEEKKEEPK